MNNTLISLPASKPHPIQHLKLAPEENPGLWAMVSNPTHCNRRDRLSGYSDICSALERDLKRLKTLSLIVCIIHQSECLLPLLLHYTLN